MDYNYRKKDAIINLINMEKLPYNNINKNLFDDISLIICLLILLCLLFIFSYMLSLAVDYFISILFLSYKTVHSILNIKYYI